MPKKSQWLNNKKKIWKSSNIIKKPCYGCGYCPYGQLVEEFPLSEKITKFSCKLFGHDCPVFYLAEKWDKMFKMH